MLFLNRCLRLVNLKRACNRHGAYVRFRIYCFLVDLALNFRVSHIRHAMKNRFEAVHRWSRRHIR